MTRIGTRLSRILAVIVTIGLVLVAIGALAGSVAIVAGLVEPSIFSSMSGRMNGRPVDLSDPQQVITMGVVVLIACLLAATALWQLLGLLRSAAAGAPFTLDNVRRLQILAGVFGASLLLQLFAFVLPDGLRGVIALKSSDLDGGTILSALFALVLAEVFREGVRLSEDVEGTI